MFSEILKIKPMLEPATAARMEKSLNQRFARVATRFGAGLKKVVAGSVLGISLGLLSKILNPLEEIEDKIKRLLSDGESLEERAARYGTSPGQLRGIENAFIAQGASPEAVERMMSAFATAIENAHWEIKTTGKPQSETSRSVQQFARELDIHGNKASLFVDFIDSLRAIWQGSGREVSFPVDGGKRKVQLSGTEFLGMSEKLVFGSEQTGAIRRVIEMGMDSARMSAKTPENEITNAVQKISPLNRLNNLLEARRKDMEMIQSAASMNEKIIRIMDEREKLRLSREQEQLKNFQDLAKGAMAIGKVMNEIKGLLDKITIGISKIVEFFESFSKKSSNMPRFTGPPVGNSWKDK